MERKEITAWGMNTWTKDNGLIMFDEFAYGKIKERIENYVEMVEGDEYGTWECIEIKTLEKFSSYDAPDIAGGRCCLLCRAHTPLTLYLCKRVSDYGI